MKQFDQKKTGNEQRRIDRERQLQIINDFGMKLLHKTTINEIVWLVAKSVIAKMGFVDCIVYLVDESNTKLIQKAAHGTKNPAKQEILNPIVINIGEGIVGSVAKKGTPELIHDTSKDERYIVDDSPRLSEIAVPIIYEDRVMGVIDSEHPDANAFDENDLTILTTIAAMSSIKIAHAETLQNLKRHKKTLEEKVKEHTQDLTQTIASLKKSNQDLERFAYAASHDMQEPLRTIVSYLQLIKNREKSLDEESIEFLDYAVGGAKRMKNLLDNLLKYSLVDSSKDVFQPVNLEEIMLWVKADLHTMITENNTRFTYQKLPVVFGNKTQIRQLFQNLVSNAIKFQKPGESAHIEISSEEKKNHHQITVKDNGLGIASAFHESIFDLFKRLNTDKIYRGSGIGLTLCRRIIEYHDGEISLQSEKGKGAIFTFTLPKKKNKTSEPGLL